MSPYVPLCSETIPKRMNSIAKTEESVEEKTEMKKETVEKISVEEEETKAQKVEEEKIETKEERAEESGSEGNRNDRLNETITNDHR